LEVCQKSFFAIFIPFTDSCGRGKDEILRLLTHPLIFKRNRFANQRYHRTNFV
jgi:hypothetical protein